MIKKKIRIIAVLTAIMLLLQLSGCSVSYVNEAQASRVDDLLTDMTIEDKIEQMMFVSYRTWKVVPETEETDPESPSETAEEDEPPENVTSLNDELRNSLKNHRYGGVLLFGENFKDAEQTVKLISDIQQANQEGGGLPLLVAADQEGGRVARIGFGTTGAGNMALGATNNAENAKTMSSIYGEELKLLGLNTDFAPVLDVNNNPNNPVIGVRSFSDDPEMVAEYGIKYMEGLHAAGMISTLKHFPGHGNTDTDSHTGFPRIMSSYEELKECELIPFQKVIDAGADMVMTAHIQYPEIETETYTSISTGEEVHLPATMSKRILTDILRDDLGFKGVLVSDALEMAAIADNFNMEDFLCISINAGVDMLIIPPVYDSKSLKELDDLTDMAIKLAKEGKIDTERIDTSVKRILELKDKYGLLSVSDFSVSEDAVEKAVTGVGSTENREKALKIANDALTLVKNDEAFPIKVDEDESVIILFAGNCATSAGAGKMLKQELLSKGLLQEGQLTVMVNDKENGSLCEEEAAKANHCILVYKTFNSNCLKPETDDGFSSAVFDRIIASRHEMDKRSILISCQLPYDAARFKDADAVLLAYNAPVMKEIPPASGEGSAYMPNLEAALMSCFAGEDTTGQLPVNIPDLDENYQMTGEILYEKGTGVLSVKQ